MSLFSLPQNTWQSINLHVRGHMPFHRKPLMNSKNALNCCLMPEGFWIVIELLEIAPETCFLTRITAGIELLYAFYGTGTFWQRFKMCTNNNYFTFYSTFRKYTPIHVYHTWTEKFLFGHVALVSRKANAERNRRRRKVSEMSTTSSNPSKLGKFSSFINFWRNRAIDNAI